MQRTHTELARKLISISNPFAALRGKTPSGGDVWVLAIKATRPSDTDLYVCEVNSEPPFKSFHPLKGNSFAVNSIASANIHIFLIICSESTECNIENDVNGKCNDG